MKLQVKIHFLITIFLLGHAHVGAQELAPGKSTYKPGEDVVISFSGGPGNAKDWVGIYKEGQTPGDDASTQYEYVAGETSGELMFDPLPVGKYEAHLFEDDGYEILASGSFEVSEESEAPKVSLSKAEYEIGEEIEVTFSGGPGNAKDWLGLYREGELTDEDDVLGWLYVDGTQEGLEGKTAGVIPVELDLAEGSYQVSLFEDDSYEMLATGSFEVRGKTELPDGVYFREDFDDLTLGAFESDSESGGDGTDWTAQGPTGWLIGKGEGHGPTAGGEAVKEFDGWTFMDLVSWNATAGQERDQFTKGKGVIAVADSDEYDDNADAKFDAWLSTPEIDITGAAAGSLVLSYDSSWRQEPQHGAVTVSFDGGEEVALLELTPDTATAYNETVELNLNNPAGAKRVVISWDHQGYNNWWWAIDNVEVYGGEG